MKDYLHSELASEMRAKGVQQGFFDALYNKSQLQLEYESVLTRTAAEAFDARSGNCLSLVIMASAFAKEVGLPVRYQRVYVEDTWGRSGDVYFSIGHVNISLGKRQIDGGFGRNDSNMMTIDFLPPRELRGVRSEVIGEETIVAMYMNNRAAELFSQGQLDDAYWSARAAIEKDPAFVGSYNTLGVIYRRHGNLKEAEQVLAYALERDPANIHVMSNLVPVLDSLGRSAEARTLARRIEQLEPDPPFSFYKRGLAAIQNSDFGTARDLFAKEIDRAPYYHEFHYWLAVAYVGLGDSEHATKELEIALQTSTSRNNRAVYAAKLDRIKSLGR